MRRLQKLVKLIFEHARKLFLYSVSSYVAKSANINNDSILIFFFLYSIPQKIWNDLKQQLCIEPNVHCYW